MVARESAFWEEVAKRKAYYNSNPIARMTLFYEVQDWRKRGYAQAPELAPERLQNMLPEALIPVYNQFAALMRPNKREDETRAH